MNTTKHHEPAKLDAIKSAAHAYVERFGFAVFPLVPQTKRPTVPGGFKAATKDHYQIEHWWNLNRGAGIGIASGERSGIIVLDQDPRNDGEESYLDLRGRFGGWGEAPICLTGSGGTHEYFRHPGDGAVPCRSHIGGFRGIDLKGDGGYVVAPPSIHPNGNAYTWDLMFGLEEITISEAPEWLIQMARKGPTVKAEAYQSEPWDGQIPDRVAYYIATRPAVSRRFNRDSTGLVDTSPSSVDFAFACCLARCGCNGSTIEAGVRASRARARNLPTKRDSYFKSTVGKAIWLAKEDLERA